MDLVQFLREGYAAQQKYAEAAGLKGPLDDLTDSERERLIIEYIGHLQEEAVEARVLVPRRPWKTNEPSIFKDPELMRAFAAELFDCMLFIRAIAAYAGINPVDFLNIAEAKHQYNRTRKDHITNGTEDAHQNPQQELSGNCESSNI